MVFHVTDKEDRFRCNTRGCRQQLQLKSNTWLQGSHLSHQTVILFVYSWCKEYTNIKFCQEELSISSHTTVDWNHFLREVCASVILRNPCQIGGPGTTVEVDELVWVRRKYNRGRTLVQQWVLGARPTCISCLLSITAPNRRCTRLIKRPSCRAAASSLTASHHTTVCPICLDTITLMKRLITLRILLTQRLEHIQIQWRGCGALRRRAIRRNGASKKA